MKTIINLKNSKVRKLFRVSSLLVVGMMVITACSNQPEAQVPETGQSEHPGASSATQAASQAGMLPEVDPGSLSGEIVIAGSSTVYPLAEAMAQRFDEEGFTSDRGSITIDSIGSGAGFERFCVAGETDIANASRKIKDSEIASCQSIGRNPIEFRIGTDALAVVVNKDNTFLSSVTLEELAKIYSSDVKNWSEVNSAWPNEEIKRFSPGTDSGTFDYFVEAVMLPVYGEDDAEWQILNSPGIQLSEDDNQLVQGVEGSPFAIGYFGFAYFQENEDLLKVVSINNITPSEATAESGEYPLARPLFIYSDVNIMEEKPQVAAFINYILTYVNEEIIRVGYFPASDESLNASKQAWLDAVK